MAWASSAIATPEAVHVAQHRDHPFFRRGAGLMAFGDGKPPDRWISANFPARVLVAWRVRARQGPTMVAPGRLRPSTEAQLLGVAHQQQSRIGADRLHNRPCQ